MAFTTADWQAQARAKYRELTGWLGRRAQDTGLMAYGALTTLTLWPLVEYTAAAASTGQSLPLAAIMALGSVAGGVGGNLLADQIQSWYEATRRGDAPTEADVLDWLQANALTREDVRPAVDQMLQALAAIPNAQAALPAGEWRTFGRQLVAEMERLGNLAHFEAELRGSGAIAQGAGATAVGERGVHVGGNVGGSINTGDQIIDPEKMEPAALRRAYLSRLLAERNQLWLGGIDPHVATEEGERLELSAVYTALLTESTVRDASPREKADVLPELAQYEDQEIHGLKLDIVSSKISALAQLNRHQHLVLLGDPGSGKSTFVNFVAACLAGEALGHDRLGLALLTTPLPPDEEEARRGGEKEEPRPQPWDHRVLLPVTVMLRDLAARNLPPAGQKATAVHLWRFIKAELEAASLAEYAPLLKKELLETGGIFLFDGLDEVPTADRHRQQIKQLVEDVARTYPRCRVLVTSRTYAYQRQEWRLPAFADAVLAPFSKGQIGRFVDRWYDHVAAVRHLDPADARGQAALLQGAIFGNERLYALAERPLLLTLMASLHAWRGGSLPEKREQLYADSVALLLDVWEKQRIVRDSDGEIRVIQPSLEQWLKVDRDRVRGLLNRLAYDAHASQLELTGTADIAEDELVMGLLALSEAKDLQPARLVEFLSNRAGLLLPRGVGVYTFPHRTFQEYLAACHLTGPGYPAEVAQLARTDPNRWREVALLAGAKAAAGSAYALWGLVEELCHEPPGAGGPAAYWGAHLAGHFVVETADLAQLTAAQAGHVARLRDWLVRVLADPVLPAIERALAGRHLAHLGDPRPEVTDVDAMQFCFVPAGPFWLGEGDEAHQVDFLDYDYWLARYPVTHAQYMAFVDEGGYGQEQWWGEALAAGVWQDGQYTGWGDARNQPYDYGPQFRLANVPVVGVSWYEALAFTRWLTARWRARGWLTENWQVTLPSEAEWEKAARGGLEIPLPPLIVAIPTLAAGAAPDLQSNPEPQRAYTWPGGELTPESANYDASEINQTSSAGAFREAASAVGCEEMLGNVFEWTRSRERKYPYDPDDGREQLQRGRSDWTILRGGSWYTDEKWQRCAARLGYNPDDDLRYYGFRVVLSPFFDSDR